MRKEGPLEPNLSEISADMTASLVRHEIADLGSSITDAAVDAALDSGMLDGIPVFGTLLSLTRAGVAIRDVLFMRKVASFLANFSVAPAEDRVKFVQDLEGKGLSEKFGGTIILLLERMDDLSKPAIVGRIMAAAAANRMPLQDALRISHIVDRAFTEDLVFLPTFVDNEVSERPLIADALFSAGLLENRGSDGGTLSNPTSGGTIYARNRYALLLLEFGLPALTSP